MFRANSFPNDDDNIGLEVFLAHGTAARCPSWTQFLSNNDAVDSINNS